MDEFLFVSLTTGVLTMLGLHAVTEIDNWRKRRRLARIQRIQRELAETQRNLEALAMQHQAWLNGQAHEARKALIMESFWASLEEPGDATSRNGRK